MKYKIEIKKIINTIFELEQVCKIIIIYQRTKILREK